MWRIVDNTNGRILTALQKHWGGRTATDALECTHGFGAVTDIAQELAYLGFKPHTDFEVRPAKATVFPPALSR
jgi:hypothetical protein